MHHLAVALTAESVERVINVAQGDIGVLALQLIHAGTVHRGFLALHSAADTTDFLEQPHLQLNHLIGSGIGAAGTDLLRLRVNNPGIVR